MCTHTRRTQHTYIYSYLERDSLVEKKKMITKREKKREEGIEENWKNDRSHSSPSRLEPVVDH